MNAIYDGFWLLPFAPGTGTTTLALQAALVLAETRKVGYFTLATTCDKLAGRLAHLHNRMEHHPDMPHLDLISASGMTVRDIQDFTLREHYQVIFVDYLRCIVSSEKSLYEREKNIVQGLRALSQSQGMTVIALRKLSRPAAKGGFAS